MVAAEGDRTAAVLRAVLESPQDIVIFALDRDYRYLAFNSNHAGTMQHIWDAEIEVGDRMLDFIKREDDRLKAKANFDRALAGEAFKREESYGDEALARRWYEDAYSPILGDDGEVVGLTVFLTDITEKRRAEESINAYRQQLESLVEERTQELSATQAQLLHAQKLESLGLMAGGIAHDFNNLLVGILGCGELALEELPDGAPGHEMVEQIVLAARRAADLTAQMLAYSGRTPFALDEVDLDALLGEHRGLLRAMIPSSVAIRFELAGNLPRLRADATRLQQVIVNLVTNAAEAIGDAQGTITVRTGCRELTREDLAGTYLDDDLEPGHFVSLSVQDDGCGMDEATRLRLFDPFFTTKLSGRGLGLASVLGIVRGHNGAIDVRSDLGDGTVVEVLLPSGGHEHAPHAPEDPTEDRTGLLLALVVDDEEYVRRVVKRMLVRADIDTIEAEDGLAAQRLIHERGADLDLVILDLTMPRQGGESTLRFIRHHHPRLPVLVLSGYGGESERLDFVAEDRYANFLAKPFTIKELSHAVDELLSAAAAR